MITQDDQRYMARALQLAARGLYTTQPNPRVGCVLVKDNRIVGEGYHVRAGDGHAEVNALAQAGGNARNATAYVTLEPCSHHGRTPPCSETLINAGVARVVSAMEDPNPQVAGNGYKQLHAAGIEVDNGVMQAQAECLNPGYLKRMRAGRPYVRCKLAMSLDGRTAMASGESKWITSAAARADVQRLRARSSAIVTGIGTVLADDPSLTVRIEELPDAPADSGLIRQPLRVVLDSALKMPATARMLGLEGDTWVCSSISADSHEAAQLQKAGATMVSLDRAADSDTGLDLNMLMQKLAAEGVNEVLVEAGSTLNGALLQAGLVDELVIYMAPKLMGDSARGLFHLAGLERMAQAVELVISDIRAVGRDWRITAVPSDGAAGGK